jgi:dTDP-4-dehydrorhamnose reductase
VVGTYHIAGSEKISRFEFAKKIANVFGLDERLIIPISMKDIPTSVEIARDTSLDTTKAVGELELKILDVGSGVMLMRNLIESELLRR